MGSRDKELLIPVADGEEDAEASLLEEDKLKPSSSFSS